MTQENPPRDSQGRFLKGFSGNPKGPPKGLAEFRAKIRGYSDEALEVIVEGLRSDNPKISIPCAQEILNRAFGKAEQAHKVDGESTGLTVIVVEDGALETGPEPGPDRGDQNPPSPDL